jgi:voltage-gated potassium channel
MNRGDPPSRRLLLRRVRRHRDWVSLLLRVGIVFLLIGVALAVHWFDRGGLRDAVNGKPTFLDVLYFTMITVTTVGYGDIVPVTERARLFDTFLVTPIRIFIWLIFIGTAYQFLLRNVWEDWRMSRIQRQLRDHVIIAGYGTSGSEAVSELLRRGFPVERIVVVDPRPTALERAAAVGVAVLEGDATSNATLQAVEIARARCIAVSAGRDDTSILIVLTAHGLAPNLPISVVVRAEDNEDLARQAGASTVINPASFAGLLLAGSTDGPHLSEYLTDLAAHHGRVALHEREVTAGEVGKPLAAITSGLGVRVYRGGKVYGFWEPESATLRAGDTILEIVPRGEPGPG